MRKRTWLRLGYILLLIMVLLVFHAARKRSGDEKFFVNSSETLEVMVSRLGEPDFLDQETGEMLWYLRSLFVRFEIRVLFDTDGLPGSVLCLRHIGPSWAEWTLVTDDYRRSCSDFCPERGCP